MKIFVFIMLVFKSSFVMIRFWPWMIHFMLTFLKFFLTKLIHVLERKKIKSWYHRVLEFLIHNFFVRYRRTYILYKQAFNSTQVWYLHSILFKTIGQKRFKAAVIRKNFWSWYINIGKSCSLKFVIFYFLLIKNLIVARQ